MIRRSSTKLHFQTQIVSALFAVIAKSTRDPRLNGNAVSNLQMFDVFAAPRKGVPSRSFSAKSKEEELNASGLRSGNAKKGRRCT